MSEIGKAIRLERIMKRKSRKMVIIPMDHGVSLGPIDGLVDMASTMTEISKGGADAVLLHKGLVNAGHRGSGEDMGLIVHASASTSMAPDSNTKVPVCSVRRAVQLGADAFSVHINLGAKEEAEMLAYLGRVSEECNDYGMPLLAMMYARGKKIGKAGEYDAKYVKHAARVAAELGADIVKCNFTGSAKSFKEVVEGCHVPVVIAGGEKKEGGDMTLLEMVEQSMEAGAAGISIGRNAFQHKDVESIVLAMCAIVHGGSTAEKAHRLLKNDN